VTSSGPANYGGGRSPNGTTTPTSTSNKSTTSSSGGGGKSQLHVDFIEHGEVKEKREKYLTAKYGSHQMSLIRKRLSVEMWLYDELQKLYEEEVRRNLNNLHFLINIWTHQIQLLLSAYICIPRLHITFLTRSRHICATIRLHVYTRI